MKINQKAGASLIALALLFSQNVRAGMVAPPNYSRLPATVFSAGWLQVKIVLTDGIAVLTWATSTETDTKEFVVQHGTDATHLSMIGHLPAAGNSNNSQTYSFSHPSPAPGFNYYRVQLIDEDGKLSYSKTVVLYVPE